MSLVNWALHTLSKYLPENRIEISGDTYLRRFYLCGPLSPQLAEYFKHGPAPRERGLRFSRALSTVLGKDPASLYYLHCFKRPDRDRHLHNHPFDGDAYVIAGAGYIEERYLGQPSEPGALKVMRMVRRFSVNRLRANTYHTIKLLLSDEVWTIFVVGKKQQSWGFWVEELKRHVPHREYHKVLEQLRAA